MQAADPVRRQWSRAEYYKMAELGWFNGQRAELVDGEVVVVNPQNVPHYASITKVVNRLTHIFGDGFWVRAQGPLACGPSSEPEPDVAVVAGSIDDYTDHPTSALLVVEVSDTSLRFDRTEKMGLYARCGIADYWIINLVDRAVEVHRDPIEDGSQPFGFRYREVVRLAATESIAPLAKPEASLAVADMLP